MARKSGFTIKREISLGVVLQIVSLVVSSIYFVAKFEGRIEVILENQGRMTATAEEIRMRVDRIEKYLSSKDSKYWQAVKTLEEEARK